MGYVSGLRVPRWLRESVTKRRGPTVPKSSGAGNREMFVEFHGEQWPRALEGELNLVRADMVTCAHLPTELGRPPIDIPFETCGGDQSASEDGNDTDVLCKISRL